MSISLVDQHLINEITSLLRSILSNHYIIKQEILSQLPNDIVNSFINTYGTSNTDAGKDIPIYYAFPQSPPRTAFLLAQFKGATEDPDNDVLGNLEGPVTDNDEGQIVHEKVKVKLALHDSDPTAYANTTYLIKRIVSIPQTTTYDFEDNQIGFPYLPIYKDGKTVFDVYYVTKRQAKGQSIPIGINTQEAVTVDFISSNIDTIRCLSGIFTYIEVYLRKTLDENSNVYLPSIELNGMDMVQDANTPDNSIGGQQLFYRRLSITYHVTQVIGQNAGPKLTKINLSEEDD